VSKDIPVQFVVYFKDYNGVTREFETWAYTGNDAIETWEQERKARYDTFVKVVER
jgi:hypothetical protein